jgi:hypothetical protein
MSTDIFTLKSLNNLFLQQIKQLIKLAKYTEHITKDYKDQSL